MPGGGAVSVLLDEKPIRLPDLPLDRPILVPCLCRGETSSSRIALALADPGYRDVAVPGGGLDAWEAASGAVEAIDVEAARTGGAGR